MSTGFPWRDLPPDYGDWKNTHRRFSRWRDRGVWEALLEQKLIEGMSAVHLLADRGYDSDAFVCQLRGMEPVIPPRCNRKEKRLYDRKLYKHRHLVENAFLYLKQ